MSKTQQKPTDFNSLEQLMGAMYQSVSGPTRGLDMQLQRQVFAPDARLTRTGLSDDGSVWRQDMNLEEYEADTRDFLASTDFYEIEIDQKIMHSPPFAYVLSEYVARENPASEALILAGVNSVQCLFDGARWWVTQLTWNHRA